ncbi:MAG: hypothetical protein GY854_18140 [Deltaproteobacteria bacterium]|nr:hypothetical protein [Deltaproteobacteria bacterium]
MVESLLGALTLAGVIAAVFFELQARAVRRRLSRICARAERTFQLSKEVRSLKRRRGSGVRSERIELSVVGTISIDKDCPTETVEAVREVVGEVQAGQLLLDRGLAQLMSESVPEVLSGCQTMLALGDSGMIDILKGVGAVWEDNLRVKECVERVIISLGGNVEMGEEKQALAISGKQ